MSYQQQMLNQIIVDMVDAVKIMSDLKAENASLKAENAGLKEINIMLKQQLSDLKPVRGGGYMG